MRALRRQDPNNVVLVNLCVWINFNPTHTKLLLILTVVPTCSCLFLRTSYSSARCTNKYERPQEKGRLFLFPALIVWILILITSFGNIQGPLYSLRSPMNVAGALIFLIGLAIRSSAVASLNRSYSWTLEIRDEHRLVKDGLYRYVRHPIYLGVLLGAIAVPVYTTSFLGFLFALMGIPLFIYRMGVEEKMLIEEYGDEYLEYMKATSKLIPYIY